MPSVLVESPERISKLIGMETREREREIRPTGDDGWNYRRPIIAALAFRLRGIIEDEGFGEARKSVSVRSCGIFAASPSRPCFLASAHLTHVAARYEICDRPAAKFINNRARHTRRARIYAFTKERSRARTRATASRHRLRFVMDSDREEKKSYARARVQ